MAVIQVHGTYVQALGGEEHMLIGTGGDYESALSAARHDQAADPDVNKRFNVVRKSSHTGFRCRIQSSAIFPKVFSPAATLS